MKNLIYTVCSPYYEPILRLTAPRFIDYALRFNADFKVFTNKDTGDDPTSITNRQPHFVSKFTSILNTGPNYSKALYLDSDIFIKPTAQNIFELPISIGGRKSAFFVDENERLQRIAKEAFPLFNKEYFINGGMFVGDYEAVRFFCSKVVELINKREKQTNEHITDEAYMAEALRMHFPDYTDVGFSWNVSHSNNKVEHNFVHCMARNLEGKVKQIRSLIDSFTY